MRIAVSALRVASQNRKVLSEVAWITKNWIWQLRLKFKLLFQLATFGTAHNLLAFSSRIYLYNKAQFIRVCALFWKISLLECIFPPWMHHPSWMLQCFLNASFQYIFLFVHFSLRISLVPLPYQILQPSWNASLWKQFEAFKLNCFKAFKESWCIQGGK